MAEGEEKKSLLYKLKPVTDRLPAVTKPEGHVHFRTKMSWVILILVLYFAMTNVVIYGLDAEQRIDLFAQYRAILAGAQFSLMHLGIGPIVTGSIIMQLFTGAKIIKLDLKNAEDKAIYQGTQKLLVLVMIVVESVPQVYGFMEPSSKFINMSDSLWGGNGVSLARTFIVIQLFAGSYLVFLMDEVVSKWGIGSGISLFIAAGVSQQIFTGSLNWHPANPSVAMGLSNPPAGTIPKTIYIFHHMSAPELSNGGYEQIFLAQPNPMVALIGTIVIFLFVAYTESSRIELPLAHGGARGARGRYPIKLIYASNIPVILMAALLANVSMFSMLFASHPSFVNMPLLGENWMMGYYADGYTTPAGGLAYYLSTVNGVGDWLLPLLSGDYLASYNDGIGATALGEIKTRVQIGIHVIAYFTVMVAGSILFAKFWIETTNMGPEAVASQIESSGMQIPGFRRDPRVLKRVLERYIPVVTIISGAVVGALAAGADLIGTVGNASGTGVLLAVGIMIQLYDAIGREQMMEMHPVLRGFFGGE